MSALVVRYPIRFAHCDAAGIAYYPRLFELCDAAIEDWCAAVLGVPRRIMHLELGLGMPTVDMRANFAAPCRLGETIDVAVSVEAIGESSIGLKASVGCDNRPRFEVRYTQVLTTLADLRPTPWREDWRARIDPTSKGGET